jgi:hypothetical protein
MLIFIFSDWRIEINSLLVNWAPWSVLKYSGFPFSRASFKASQQKSVSQSVGDSPGDDVTAVEIHNSHKIDKSMLQTDVGYIGCPRHVRLINGYIPEKIGIDLMLFIRKTQSFSGIDRLYPENPHQTPGSLPADFKSSPLQLPAHPPASVYGEVQVNFIHFLKNPLILLAQPDPFVIERGPVKRKYLALPPNAQLLVILFHKFPL